MSLCECFQEGFAEAMAGKTFSQSGGQGLLGSSLDVKRFEGKATAFVCPLLTPSR